MSKAKDRARAEAGNPHISVSSPQTYRQYVCAHCHKPPYQDKGGEFVKVGDYYFHAKCPKRMIPFSKVELIKLNRKGGQSEIGNA